MHLNSRIQNYIIITYVNLSVGTSTDWALHVPDRPFHPSFHSLVGSRILKEDTLSPTPCLFLTSIYEIKIMCEIPNRSHDTGITTHEIDRWNSVHAQRALHALVLGYADYIKRARVWRISILEIEDQSRNHWELGSRLQSVKRPIWRQNI